ncbi:MAG: YesL family protein [Lachnospiraceae bacterium]|nr:YesL family protein [Lachnospiraceae bacterium]
MKKFFDVNNPLMRFLTLLVDLVIVNLMTLVFMIPIVTTGGSLAAMNYVLLHLRRKDETYVMRMFIKSFKENFKQGIPEGLLFLLMVCIAGVDLWAMHGSESRMLTFLMIIISIIAAFFIVVFVYVFALQSRYENTVKETFLNAFRLAVGNLLRTIVMMVLWVIWIGGTIYFHRFSMLVFVIYGLTLPGYLCTMLYDPVFAKLEKE